MLRINYKPNFDWWKTNGGDKYNHQFDLFTVICANYSTPLFYLSKLFASPLNQLDVQQIRFVIDQLFPYTIYVQNNKKRGLLTPKSFCETVKLSSTDKDDLFDAWFTNPATPSIRGGKGIKEEIPLVYVQSSAITGPKGETWYTYNLKATEDGFYGLYPDNTDTTSWSGLILEWLNGTPGATAWVMEPDKNDVLHPRYTLDDGKAYTKWFLDNGTDEDAGRPDNFLARMGIMPDTPLVTYFCGAKFSTDGMPVDAIAFQHLLAPSGTNSGGWIGFLNGIKGGTDGSQDYYVKLIRTGTDDPAAPLPPGCKPANAGNGIAAGLIAFLGIAAFLSAPETGGSSIPLIFGAFSAVTSGVISGYQAGKGTC
jgi:hypothetical protein